MAVKKTTKTGGTKKLTKTQIAQMKKQQILSNLGKGFAVQYSNEALDNINIELLNNNADIKDTLLITFIDDETGNPAEQWKVTLVKKAKMWIYGEDYLEEDIKASFKEGYDNVKANCTDTETKEEPESDNANIENGGKTNTIDNDTNKIE